MTAHEHTINRANSTRTNADEDAGDDDENDEQRSEAEIKRALRKSDVGRAILRQNRALKRSREVFR